MKNIVLAVTVLIGFSIVADSADAQVRVLRRGIFGQPRAAIVGNNIVQFSRFGPVRVRQLNNGFGGFSNSRFSGFSNGSFSNGGFSGISVRAPFTNVQIGGYGGGFSGFSSGFQFQQQQQIQVSPFAAGFIVGQLHCNGFFQ